MGVGENLRSSRRDFLFVTTASVFAVGTPAVVWSLINSLSPADDVRALGVSVEVDLSPIEVGQRITVMWRSMPIFIDHRSQEQISEARAIDLAELRDPQRDEDRALRPEWLIQVGICTHLGCIPLGQQSGDPVGDWGGWYCACHGSQYDTSGRVRKGPAPRNLEIPPYDFVSDMMLRIG
jgi:ubiquinol-cytochrome c reductase iron-sulfur subunit